MPRPVYNDAAPFYVAFVDRMLADPDSFWHPLLQRYDELLGPDLPGQRVLDLACGEGHLARRLCAFGPGSVLGIDLAPALIQVAAERADDPRLSFRVDDAQTLATVPDASVDVAVSKLALMDVADHRALFQATARVLVPGSRFLFSLLHPCFEAPFHEERAPRFLLDEAGERLAYRIQTYAQEGPWQSGGSGVRGRLGAHHRTLSTLVNDLLAADFTLRGLHELFSAPSGLLAQVPQTLLLDAERRP
ncbi:class I SAM-dependent methyltransferase [Deinococcus aquaedulcis]|uniref:class I SAM-dependent methyltransferase n=1 Tax=Deinococcus aquaedulcis TaxID=2840455 RepID=UPI001C82A8FA|nr:class I SAM-dependent methyltransferase [Deinococcus aquaedulcis]